MSVLTTYTPGVRTCVGPKLARAIFRLVCAPRTRKKPITNRVIAAGRTAEALKAKAHHDLFVFSLGTGHCDRRAFEQTLADTLVWAWRGYQLDQVSGPMS